MHGYSEMLHLMVGQFEGQFEGAEPEPPDRSWKSGIGWVELARLRQEMKEFLDKMEEIMTLNGSDELARRLRACRVEDSPGPRH